MPIAVGGPTTGGSAAQQTSTKQLVSSLQRLNSNTGQNATLEGYGATGHQGFLDQLKTALGNPAENVLNATIGQAERPWQAILHGAENRNEGLAGILKGAAQGFQGSDTGWSAVPQNSLNVRQAVITPMLTDLATASPAQKQSAEAFAGKAGGLGGAALDLGASAADPANFLGGAGELLKAGKLISNPATRDALRAVAATNPDLAAKVAAVGTKGLAPAEMDAAVSAVRNDAAKAATAPAEKALADAQANHTALLKQSVAGPGPAATLGESVDHAIKTADAIKANADTIKSAAAGLAQAHTTTGAAADAAEAKAFGAPSRLGNTQGSLAQPQGLKFAGRTVLKQSTVADAAGKLASPLGDVLSKIPGSAKAAEVAKSAGETVAGGLKARAATARSLGQVAADTFLNQHASAVTRAAVKSSDLRNAIEHKISKLPKGFDLTNFDENVLTPALETGKHEELAASLRSKGPNPVADLVDLAHGLRVKTAQERRESGALKTSELKINNNKYVPTAAPTKEGQAWLDNRENLAKAHEIMGHTPAHSNGVLRGVQTFARKVPGDTIKERNAYLAEHTGVAKFFPESGLHALLSDAVAAHRETGMSELLHSLTGEVDEHGNQLLHKAVDNSDKIAAETASRKAALAPVNRRIVQLNLSKGVAQEGRQASERGLKASALRIGALQRAVDKAQSLVSKHEGRTIAAGADKRAAGDAGKVSDVAERKLSTVAEVRAQFRELLSDPTLPADVAADLRKEEAAAILEVRKEAEHIASQTAAKGAVAASKGVQQRIGRTGAAAKYEGVLHTAAKAQQARAEKALAKESTRHAKMLTQAPISKAARDAELTQRKAQRDEIKTTSRSKVASLKAEEEAARPAGTAELKVAGGKMGSFYGHPDLISDIEDLEQKAHDPGFAEKVQRYAQDGTQAMKNLTLNLPPFILASNGKNQAGDMIQMIQEGFSDPTAYKPAGRIIKAIVSPNQSLAKTIIKGGTDRAGKTRAEGLEGLSAEDRNTVREMDSVGLLDTGQTKADLSHSPLALTDAEKRKAALDPRNAESIWTRHGAQVRDIQDQVNRIAMFVDGRRKGLSVQAAADQARRGLYDYKDNTKFDAQAKKYILFYSFLKKNVEQQGRAVLTHPARMINVQRAQDQAATVNPDSAGNTVLPGYALKAGQVPLGSVGGIPILGGFQTPQAQAMQSVQPLVDIATAIAAPKKYQTQAGLSGGLGALTQNLGGLLPTVATQLLSETAGKNIVTGAPLSPARSDLYRRNIEAFIPRGSQFRGGLTQTGATGPGTTDAEKTAYILGLLGVSSTAVTPQKSYDEILNRNQQITTAAKAQGIPAASALKKAAVSKAKK